jgi:hypothetical protein
MTAMKDFFAQYYNAAGAAPNSEQLEKNAQMELFCKLAAQNNVDLEKLSEEQIQQLWSLTFEEKAAEFPPKKEEHEEKKPEHKLEEKAKEEHDKKKEAAAKVAEADFCGRYMAHAMVDELKKMAAAGESVTKQAAAAAGTPAPEATPETETKEAAMPEGLKKGLERVGHHFENTGRKMLPKQHAQTAGDIAEGVIRGGPKKSTARAVGAAAHGAAAAGAAGAAAAAHHHLKEKKSSAVDQLAASEAVKIAFDAGFDPEEAGERLSAVLTLGVPESEKIASVQDLDVAKGIRALELLELAGYPVTWTPNA